MATDTVRQHAPAKINLALHVTGQRADGYHLLDSLVMFSRFGDVIEVAPAEDLTLTIQGPFASGLSTTDNLVLDAARAFGLDHGAHMTLTKNLPLASGIGGGSADAAATLIALSNHWNVPLPDWETTTGLGADVGLCLSTELTRMSGIGDKVQRLGPTPPVDLLLVNPGVALSTPKVFASLDNKNNAAMSDPMPDPFDRGEWGAWLRNQRNDLQEAAIRQAPQVSDVLTALQSQDGCQLARMSGSGATCFAIFDDVKTCDTAARNLSSQNPSWWVQRTAPI